MIVMFSANIIDIKIIGLFKHDDHAKNKFNFKWYRLQSENFKVESIDIKDNANILQR